MRLNRTTSLILFGLIVIIGIVLAVTKDMRKGIEITVQQDETDLVEDFTGTDLVSGTYAIDTVNSSIEWVARKKVIPNYKDVGTLAPAKGVITLEDEMLTEGEVVIDVGSLEVTETGVGGGFSGLARDLLSDRFLGAEQFPEATFTLTGAEGSRKNNFNITGDLTIKGVTQSVETVVSVESVSLESIVLQGELTIDRTAYGITFGSDQFFDDLGDRVIDDAVDLMVSLQATRVE